MKRSESELDTRPWWPPVKPKRQHPLAFLLAPIAVLLWTAVSPCAAESAEKGLAVRLPAFAPRASAASIVCSPSSSVSLQAKNEGAEGNPLKDAAVIAQIVAGSESLEPPNMRLRFDANLLKVSFGYTLGKKFTWGPDWDYSVQSDAAQDYVATKKGSGEMGMLQTLVLNRVTGSAILTLAVASLPSGGHPFVDSTFYVCQPER
jgi:hypothetical protein